MCFPRFGLCAPIASVEVAVTDCLGYVPELYVLAFVKEQAVLLTGLVNPQVIRTAEMMDMHCIIFVRGKRPDLKMIEMAEERDMVILCTELEMFTACGRLYQGGLRGGSGK